MTKRYPLLLGILTLGAAASLRAQEPRPSAAPRLQMTAPTSPRLPNVGPSRWSNFYVGASVGGGWNQPKSDAFTFPYQNVTNIFVPGRGIVIVPGTTGALKATSANWGGAPAIGIQGGYMRTVFNRPWRIEADFNSNSSDESIHYALLLGTTALAYANPVRLQRDFHTSWTSSLRLRGDGNLLGTVVYGTAGFAMAHATMTGRDSTFALPNSELVVRIPATTFAASGFQSSATQTHSGWTVGGGTERKLSPRTTIALEYRYSDYGKKSYTLGAAATSAYAQDALTGAAGTHGSILSSIQPIHLRGAQITARANVRLPLW